MRENLILIVKKLAKNVTSILERHYKWFHIHIEPIAKYINFKTINIKNSKTIYFLKIFS